MRTLDSLAKEIKAIRESKSFSTPDRIDSSPYHLFVTYGDLMLGKLMLVVTEISEAAEAVRHDNLEGFVEELADAMIRLLDISATIEIDIELAILSKMAVNRERPPLHGKETSL